MDDAFIGRMNSELAGWSDPVRRLRGAIDKDEFELYCQPILDLTDGGFPMAEVLVRMREEERALLPPGEFLPVFEHYRMMPQLDRWVVRHTAKHLAHGSRMAGFTINVSGQTVEDAEFPRFVAGQLAAHKLAPASLGFEIDEADTLVRLESVERFAAAMKSVGTPLLIDGFARRAVSFSPLRNLAVQFVKVDGSITRKLLVSEHARNKLNAILRVGERFGFRTVSECVEEQDVLLRLKALGVGFAQGFGIAQPHPIDRLALAA